MAKNVSVMALLAAVKRGFWKKRMSSIGVGVCSSQTMNDAIATMPTANEPSTSGSVQPFAGPSMMPKSSAPRPTIESTAPSGSRCAVARVLRGRHEEPPGDERQRDERQVDPEHRAPLEVAQQQPAGDRADGDGEAGEAGPHGDGPAPLARVAEDVGEDRQRRRHDQRPADAHEGAAGDELRGGRRQRRRHRADGEQDEADLQARPCGRSGRSGCRWSAGGRRTRACRRR